MPGGVIVARHFLNPFQNKKCPSAGTDEHFEKLKLMTKLKQKDSGSKQPVSISLLEHRIVKAAELIQEKADAIEFLNIHAPIDHRDSYRKADMCLRYLLTEINELDFHDLRPQAQLMMPLTGAAFS